MIIRSAGFIDTSMIRSQNNLNFSYIVYLVLRHQKEDAAKIESLVRRWYVMSVLTGRYSSSPESMFDFDIKRIDEMGAEQYLSNIQEALLSNAFWDAGLPQEMNTSVASSPFFKVYLASQVHANDKGFLSKDITVRELITHRGDVHHLFPRNYLKSNGLSQGRYNQIANYVMMQSEINIAIADKVPSLYFSQLLEQCETGNAVYGGIMDKELLLKNLAMHCIPTGMENKEIAHYDDFLHERRILMAQKIKYYYSIL
jgi:hypothetical protein